jgi:murein DD-endopeptidase MepM/ murein hydrolase activator NlpD
MNGSGLQDESSFIYDPERLDDRSQPLQPDLDKAIREYVSSHPDLIKGDLVIISEPGLSGYKVCIGKDCKTTSQDGGFSIQDNTGNQPEFLNITDRYANTPAFAMRYINEWKGALIIPAYEMNGVKVSEQRLNDTLTILLRDGINLLDINNHDIGLMQGFLTLQSNRIIYSFFDLNPQKGEAKAWNGNTHISGGPNEPGTYDNHLGLDFKNRVGEIIQSSAPGFVVFSGVLPDTHPCAGAFNLSIDHGRGFMTSYGHDEALLVKKGEKIYRGQIIVLSGDTGKCVEFPHLHSGFYINDRDTDFYRDVNNELSTGFWTVDNLPQYPNVEIAQ